MSDTFYRALLSRDRRFDGLFFVGVTTTGIYCRPVCTARPPRQDRCRFFSRAAEAEREGFRACFVCRPELAPGNAPVDALPKLVESAVRRIEQGALNTLSVAQLAKEFGVTDRHLRRAMVKELGLSPVELAQTTRLAFAKRLLQDSPLKLADIAFASGFQSVRRFNSAFRARFTRSPTTVRRSLGGVTSDEVRLVLDYRPPLAWDNLLAFLKLRSIPGVERVEDGIYRRTLTVNGKRGWVEVAPHPKRPALVATVSTSLLPVLMPLVAKLRTLFDLDAHPVKIDAHLKQHAALKPLVGRTAGLRVPGAVDGFEAAVRAVLGQQVTVRAATTIAGRLVAQLGEPLKGAPEGLTHTFPSAARVAASNVDVIARLGMPGARASALLGLARAVRDGLALETGRDVDLTLTALKALPGFGDWTAQYIAMRALHWPDAFPAADLGVLKALNTKNPRESQARSQAWRPWRAYAVLHLWNAGATP